MRKRPRFHFTPTQGWINDPHGIVWDGSWYHMFFQYIPDSLKWESNLDWGHAVSSDLIDWQQIDSALVPENEVGCWSGSAVAVNDGFLIFYTRPAQGEWSNGQVVVVKTNSELTTFQRVEPPVITSAPEERFFDFRDPQVRKSGEGFVMTIGAGIRDFGGCALQFSSLDAYTWNFDGVLASRSKDDTEPVATGTVWECPQFFQLGSKWCLIISSINPDTYQKVQYALGDYDGKVFQPDTWGHLGYSEIPYATTTFQDHEGRRCLMSWLKESGEVSEYAGAQSVPMVVEEVGGKLTVDIHPNLLRYFKETDESTVTTHSWLSVSEVETSFSVTLTSGDNHIDIRIENFSVTTSVNEDVRTFDIPRAVQRAEILIDADILEIVLPEVPMTLAIRIPVQDGWDISSKGIQAMTNRNYLG